MFHAAMSYLVLARKYRPQTFEQVIGQEHVTRTLQNAIERGRIHHAFLFCGGRGTGKTTTARILAKALSCENAPTPQPCNVCPACVEITQGTSVDVQEIDAASQNRVEDIRDLREAIRYAPVRGKKKLYILDEVHMLSTSAFNALLKTLEEPPPHAVFVFATTDPHKLPQTILSRVQRYDFKLVPTSRLVDHLADVLGQEGLQFDRSALSLIAREGAGSVRDSLSLLDQVLASAQGPLTEAQAAAVLGVADRGLILGLGRAILGRNAGEAVSLVAHAYERGFDLVQLARTLLAHLRDLVIVSVVKDPLPLLDVTAGELDELHAQAALAKGRVELLFDRMVRVAEETSRAALTRYVLEVGLVELCSVEPLQPVGELIERLELMEDRLAGKASPAGGRGGAPPAGPGSGRSSAGGGGYGEGTAPAGPPGGRHTGSAGPSLAAGPGMPAGPGTPAGPVIPTGPGMSAGPGISAGPGMSAGPDMSAGPGLSAGPGMAAEPSMAAGPGISAGVSLAAGPNISTGPGPADSSQALSYARPNGVTSAAASSASIQSVGGARGLAAAAAAPSGALASAAALPARMPTATVIEHMAPVLAPALPPPQLAPSGPAAQAPPDPSPIAPPSASAAPTAGTSASAQPADGPPPITDSEFKQATDRISEDAKSLSFLSHARPLFFAHGRLILGHTDFNLQWAQAKAAEIQSKYSAEFKRPVQIEHKLDTTDAGSRKSLVQDKEHALLEARARRRREALEHPARGLVREVFGDVSFLEPTLEPEVNLHG